MPGRPWFRQVEEPVSTRRSKAAQVWKVADFRFGCDQGRQAIIELVANQRLTCGQFIIEPFHQRVIDRPQFHDAAPEFEAKFAVTVHIVGEQPDAEEQVVAEGAR